MDVQERIRHLLDQQPFAVLCTQGDGQPYGSLIAYAASDDLVTVVFATPVDTRKYRLLQECDRVALVVDSRSAFPEEVMEVEALTATGRALALEPSEPAFDLWADLLTSRHPQLSSFLVAPSSALFRIEIERYVYVSHIEQVSQWIPGVVK